MNLAQIPPDITSTGVVTDFAGKFGFPALLVLVLLYGIYMMQKRADQKQDTREKTDSEERLAREARDDKREAERREEREADRKAHVDALAQHMASINNLGLAVMETGRKVDVLVDATREQVLRVAKGG